MGVRHLFLYPRGGYKVDEKGTIVESLFQTLSWDVWKLVYDSIGIHTNMYDSMGDSGGQNLSAIAFWSQQH